MAIKNREYILLISAIIFFFVDTTYANDNLIEVNVSFEGDEKELVQSVQNDLFIHSLKCDEVEWRVRHAVKK